MWKHLCHRTLHYALRALQGHCHASASGQVSSGLHIGTMNMFHANSLFLAQQIKALFSTPGTSRSPIPSPPACAGLTQRVTSKQTPCTVAMHTVRVVGPLPGSLFALSLWICPFLGAHFGHCFVLQLWHCLCLSLSLSLSWSLSEPLLWAALLAATLAGLVLRNCNQTTKAHCEDTLVSGHTCVMSWRFIPASLQACWLLMVDDLVQCLSLSDTKHVSDVAGHLSITLVAVEHPSHIQGGLRILQLVRSVSQRFPYFGELFVKVLVLPSKLPLFIGVVMFVRHGI